MSYRAGLFVVLMVVLTASSTSAVYAAAGIDSTQEYSDAYRNECAFGAAHMEVLRRYKVLLAPGYFSDLYPASFSDQTRWLTASGVDYEKVQVKTRQSVAVNSPILAMAIRDSTKPVILITHSKGSVDALDALRSDADLRTRVAGWISLQGAFFGSPVADMLVDATRLSPLFMTAILGFFGGTDESARNLTTSASLAYYRDNKSAIDEVVRAVPSIAFASSLDSSSDAQTSLEIPLQLMRLQGIRSDGLVPTDAEVLPGMPFVRISGVDHIAPVMPAVQRFDRVRMTKALLLLLKPFHDLPRPADCKESR